MRAKTVGDSSEKEKRLAVLLREVHEEFVEKSTEFAPEDRVEAAFYRLLGLVVGHIAKRWTIEQTEHMARRLVEDDRLWGLLRQMRAAEEKVRS